MSFTTWVKSCLSYRGKALSLYRSGMAKANKDDFDGAITDYSAAIQAPNTPTDVKSMALYNRALAYSAIHEDEKSVEDLTAVLEMSGLPKDIKMEAQERRERIRQRDERATDRAAQRKHE